MAFEIPQSILEMFGSLFGYFLGREGLAILRVLLVLVFLSGTGIENTSNEGLEDDSSIRK